MNVSWHRSESRPSMVYYTSKDYPVGQYGSPFEEIDDVSDTLFNQNVDGSSLPAGRPIKYPVSNSKGKGISGARTREPIDSVHAKIGLHHWFSLYRQRNLRLLQAPPMIMCLQQSPTCTAIVAIFMTNGSTTHRQILLRLQLKLHPLAPHD